MKCKHHEEDIEVDQLYELAETIACEDCWREYWQENNIGEDESFSHFKNYTLSKVN